MSPKKSFYDQSVIDQLNKAHPDLAMNPYADLPIPGPNKTVLYNGVRRTSRSIYYNGQTLSLPKFINYRLGEISKETDKFHRAEQLRAFQQEAHNLTISMPGTASLKGRAGRYAFGTSVIDYKASKDFASRFPSLEDYEAYTASVISRGGGSSGVGSHFGEGVYSRKNLMGIYPGLGSQEEVRKFATLLDFLPVGDISGPGSGVTAEASVTPRGIALSRGITNEMLSGAMQSSLGNTASQNLRNAASRTSIVAMMEYSSSPALSGGAFAIRPGAFSNYYSYETKSLLFNAKNLPTERFLDRFIHGSHISDEDINLLRSLNLEKDAEYTALLSQGMTPRQALKSLGKKPPRATNVVQSLVKEGKNYRLFYGEQRAIGPGSKLSVELRKGLTVESRMALQGVSPETQLLMSPLTSAEQARQMVPLYQKAEIYLTDKKFVPSEHRLTNLTRIAEALNAENIEKGIKSRIRVKNNSLVFPNRFAITSGHVRRVADLLPMEQQATVLALLEGVNLKGIAHPTYLHALPQLDLFKKGLIVGGGAQDIMGLLMTGQPLQARMLAEKIGKSSIGGEIKDVIQYLHNRTPVAGAKTVTQNMIDSARSIEAKSGAIVGGTGHALFDPTMAGKSDRWMLPLGHEVKLNLSGQRSESFKELPLLSLDATKLSKMPSGTVWLNHVERAKMELMHAVGRDPLNKEHIQVKAQGYIDAIAGLSGKGKTITEDVLKTRLRGTRDTMTFINDEVESLIRSRYNLAPGTTGFHVVSEKRAREILRQSFGISGIKSVRKMVDEGVYSSILRHPAAPHGFAAARMVIATPEIRAALNWGSEIQEAVSAGLGTDIHGDLDQDTLNTVTEFMGKSGVQEELKANWKARQYDYAFADYQAMSKLTRSMSPEELASQAGLSAKEVAMANIFKNRNTGIAHNAAFRVYEGAMRIGSDAGRSGAGRFTQQYAFNLANVLFTLGEESINTKRNAGGILDTPDLMKAIYLGSSGERSSLLRGMIKDEWLAPFGQNVNKNQVSQDLIEALEVGQGTVIRDLQRMNRGGANIQDLVNAVLPQPSTVVDEGLSGIFEKSAAIRGVAGQRAQNINYKDAAKAGMAEGKSILSEGVENFTKGLREGKGWTSLALGGAILAGVGLSLRKPGNITVIADANRSGEQRAPNGGYTQTNEPVVAPRKQRNLRVMDERQYGVRVRIKEAQRQDSRQFVDLANAISGKYGKSSKAKIQIKDDSSEQDYAKIFRDEYNRQLRLGA